MDNNWRVKFTCSYIFKKHWIIHVQGKDAVGLMPQSYAHFILLFQNQAKGDSMKDWIMRYAECSSESGSDEDSTEEQDIVRFYNACIYFEIGFI